MRLAAVLLPLLAGAVVARALAGAAEVAAAAAGTQASAADSTPRARALRELEAADHSLGAAYAARDVERVLAFYDDSAVAMWSGEPLRDRAALRGFVASLFADSAYQIAGTELSRAVAESGDLAYIAGRTTRFRRTTAAGVVTVSGGWTLVWRRRPEGWRIIVETFTAGGG
jgi:ketosteroid isomerase-like protein